MAHKNIIHFDCDLTLNIEFSYQSIASLLQRCKALNFEFKATTLAGMQTVSSDIDEIVNYLMLGWQKPSGLEDWSPRLEIKKKNETFLSKVLLFSDDNNKLNPWIYDTNYTVLADLLDCFDIYRVIMLTCYDHRAENAVVADDELIAQKFSRPSIGIQFESRFYREEGVEEAFKRNISATNCSLHLIEEKSEGKSLRYKHYWIEGPNFVGDLIIDNETYWLAPKESYKMHQYNNEYAINSRFYIDFVLQACIGLQIYYLKTFNFDNYEET